MTTGVGGCLALYIDSLLYGRKRFTEIWRDTLLESSVLTYGWLKETGNWKCVGDNYSTVLFEYCISRLSRKSKILLHTHTVIRTIEIKNIWKREKETIGEGRSRTIGTNIDFIIKNNDVKTMLRTLFDLRKSKNINW